MNTSDQLENTGNNENKINGLDELKAENADLKQQLESLRNKTDELLTETKKAKAAKREALELAEKEAREKAEKENDYKQLFESSDQKVKALEEQLSSIRHEQEFSKHKEAAMSLASELTKDATRRDLLTEQFLKRTKVTEEGLKVLNENGELTVSSTDELKSQISERYAFLVDGTQASGGSAKGNVTSGATSKQMSRSVFEKSSPNEQADFMRSGGKLTDD